MGVDAYQDAGMRALDVRLARLEEQSGAAKDAAAVFRVSAVERMSRIEVSQERTAAKVDAIAAMLADMQTTLRVSSGVAGWIARVVPGVWAAIGAATAWVVAHLWPGS